ncbi:MAG: hypothetical protein V3U19_09975, partial [Thermodesulfobacteriota bacterium]
TKDDIRLSGDVILSGFKFNPAKEDTPSVNNLDCELDFKQNLNVSSSFPFHLLESVRSKNSSGIRREK